MYTRLSMDTPSTSTPNTATSWARSRRATGPKYKGSLQLICGLLLLQIFLVLLAALGVMYLVRLHITGTLHPLPSYTSAQVRDAGWTRARVSSDPVEDSQYPWISS